MAKNIIELNGKKYDAVSGALINTTDQSTTKVKPLVDSFVRQKPTEVPSKTATVADPSPLQKTQLADFRQSTAHHLQAHKPQHPKTLMRSAVRQPKAVAATKIKVAAPTPVEQSVARTTSSVHKLSVSSINQSRLQRSQQTSRYGTINRFSDVSTNSIPQATPAQNTDINPVSVAPSVVPVQAPQRSQALFDQAMANARSHEEKYAGPQHSRGLRPAHVAMLVSAFAIIFFAGFLMYRSVPSMNLSLASAKAGFHASLPGYDPPGFSLGHFNYGPGSVTINYHSNSDDRKFSVIQRTSNWDSSTLLTNFVKLTNQPYQTYQVSGRTVYLYGDNSATWVDGGIWYVVNGNTALSNNQMLKMAGSI